MKSAKLKDVRNDGLMILVIKSARTLGSMNSVVGQVDSLGGVLEVEEGGQDVEEEVHGNIDRIEWSKIRRLVRKLSKQDSVPKKQKVVRYSPSGTWSALNGYTSSNELGAQYV